MALKISRVDIDVAGKWVKLNFTTSDVAEKKGLIETENQRKVHKVPHPDLANKFVQLIPHFVFLCELAPISSHTPEWFENNEFLNEDTLKGFNVTGIVISGKDLDIYKLIGNKTTSKKEVIAISAPLIWIEDQASTKYVYSEILRSTVSKLLNEAELYHKGKFDLTQPDLFPENV